MIGQSGRPDPSSLVPAAPHRGRLLDTCGMVAESAAIKELIDECDVVATASSKVLLTGESGVGKELFARYIHQRSHRRGTALVTINCAGMPETLLESELFGHVRGSFTDAHRDRRGLFEVANGGTLFLDEIGEMSMRMQTLLLRFLETGEIHRVGSDSPQRVVNVRLIAATNRDLLEEKRKQTFREDLYYRLNVVHLHIPPLRERRDDIIPLLNHHVRLASETERRPVCHLSPQATAFLEAYHWPGNVRELRNVSDRLVLRHGGSTVELEHLSNNLFEQPADQAAPGPDHAEQKNAANELLQAMGSGESFWTVVHDPFMRRDLTRDTLRHLVRLGLERTRGSYSLLCELFNLAESDHKRLMRFLHKFDCHVPIQGFRQLPASSRPLRTPHPLVDFTE